MGTLATTDLPLTISHCQFGLGLVMIVLLGLVSTASMEWSILCFCFILCLIIERSKKINKTKQNAPFYICENEPFKLMMLGDNLPWIICYQHMIIIIINVYLYTVFF